MRIQVRALLFFIISSFFTGPALAESQRDLFFPGTPKLNQILESALGDVSGRVSPGSVQRVWINNPQVLIHLQSAARDEILRPVGRFLVISQDGESGMQSAIQNLNEGDLALLPLSQWLHKSKSGYFMMLVPLVNSLKTAVLVFEFASAEGEPNVRLLLSSHGVFLASDFETGLKTLNDLRVSLESRSTIFFEPPYSDSNQAQKINGGRFQSPLPTRRLLLSLDHPEFSIGATYFQDRGGKVVVLHKTGINGAASVFHWVLRFWTMDPFLRDHPMVAQLMQYMRDLPGESDPFWASRRANLVDSVLRLGRDFVRDYEYLRVHFDSLPKIFSESLSNSPETNQIIHFTEKMMEETRVTPFRLLEVVDGIADLYTGLSNLLLQHYEHHLVLLKRYDPLDPETQIELETQFFVWVNETLSLKYPDAVKAFHRDFLRGDQRRPPRNERDRAVYTYLHWVRGLGKITKGLRNLTLEAISDHWTQYVGNKGAPSSMPPLSIHALVVYHRSSLSERAWLKNIWTLRLGSARMVFQNRAQLGLIPKVMR